VGTLLVASLLHPEESRNKALIVNSFTTTPDDILAEFEKQTASEWEVTYTSLDELKKLEAEAYASEKPFAVGFTLKRIWTEGGTLYEKRDNGLIGEPILETLADVVREVIQQQRLKTEE
jgi:hypothetical protein